MKMENCSNYEDGKCTLISCCLDVNDYKCCGKCDDLEECANTCTLLKVKQPESGAAE